MIQNFFLFWNRVFVFPPQRKEGREERERVEKEAEKEVEKELKGEVGRSRKKGAKEVEKRKKEKREMDSQPLLQKSSGLDKLRLPSFDRDLEKGSWTDESLLVEYAAVLVSEALSGKTNELISHKVSDLGQNRLRAFRFFKSGKIRFLLYMIIFVDILLPLLEPANSREPRSIKLNVVAMCLELLCMSLLAIQPAIRVMYLEREGYFGSRWKVAKVGLICLTSVEVIIWLPIVVNGGYSWRISRLFRCFFLIEQGSRARFVWETLCMTVWSLFDYVIFLLLYILMSTFVGYFLFHRISGDTYFASFDESFLSLFVLMTTANFPDVMLPAYRIHKSSAIFFILYIVIGIYLIYNMIFASLFHVYRIISTSVVHSYLEEREKLLRQAFHCLDSDQDGQLGFHSWKKLIRHLRPDIGEDEVRVLFYMVDEDHSGCISEREFSEVCDYLDLSFSLLEEREKEREEKEKGVVKRLAERVSGSLGEMIVVGLAAFFLISLTILETYLGCQVVGFWHLASCNWIPFFQVVLCFLLSLEFVIKIIAQGPRNYFLSSWNRLEGIIIMGSLIGVEIGLLLYVSGVASGPPFAWIQLVCALRILKLFITRDFFRRVISTFLEVVACLYPFFAVLLAIYYTWAILGMEFFGGRLNPGDPRLKGTDYDTLNYYCNNFNSFIESLVTLFELMVVNNWQVTMLGVVAVTNKWSELYFILFYFLTVVFVLSLILTVIVEAFLFRQETKARSDNWEAEVHHIFNKAQMDILGEEKFLIEVPKRLLRLFVAMFRIQIELPVSSSGERERGEKDERTIWKKIWERDQKPLPSRDEDEEEEEEEEEDEEEEEEEEGVMDEFRRRESRERIFRGEEDGSIPQLDPQLVIIDGDEREEERKERAMKMEVAKRKFSSRFGIQRGVSRRAVARKREKEEEKEGQEEEEREQQQKLRQQQRFLGVGRQSSRDIRDGFWERQKEKRTKRKRTRSTMNRFDSEEIQLEEYANIMIL